MMPKIKGFIDFENVHFKFDNKQNYLLRGLNLPLNQIKLWQLLVKVEGKSNYELIYRLYSPV